jgi:hypothetical protein
MTEQQRTLAGYKSQVHEPGNFDEINEGKPLLDDSVEYVFSLKEMPRVFPSVIEKKDKTGNVTKVKAEKAVCEFIEESTKNIVTTFFRVDSLNFSDEEAYESGVIKFFRKIKNPLPEFKAPEWEKHFIVGMRFRGRVVIKQKKKSDNEVIMNYYLDVPTCRPILESDKHPEAITTTAMNTPGVLANALFLVKGARTHQDAMQMLETAKASKETVMALFQAHLDGKVEYPIK